jgi:hypothetical protein
MNRCFVVACFCFVFTNVKASDSLTVNHKCNNSVSASLLGSQFPRTYHYKTRFWEITNQNIIDVFGVSYERRVGKKYLLGIGYAAWDNHPHLQQISGMSVHEPLKTGSWEYMQQFKMTDLYTGYKFDRFKRHIISVGAGISYTWGENTIIDTIYITPGWFDGIIEGHQEKADYFGLIAFVSYDYLCFKNRVAIGYKVLLRKYQGWYSTELDYGFNLKFNF